MIRRKLTRSTVNSVTSSAADPATTNTFRPSVDAVAPGAGNPLDRGRSAFCRYAERRTMLELFSFQTARNGEFRSDPFGIFCQRRNAFKDTRQSNLRPRHRAQPVAMRAFSESTSRRGHPRSEPASDPRSNYAGMMCTQTSGKLSTGGANSA